MAGNPQTGTMRRLFRLWRLYAKLDFVWITSDLRMFTSYLFSDTILNLAAVTGVLLLAERFQGIGVWTKEEIIFMLGYSITAAGICDTFFNYNVLNISRRLGRGQLDHTLIQPQPLWVALLTDGFTPFSGSSALIIGIALLCWATNLLAVPVGAGWIALLVMNLIASALIVLAFSFLWGSAAFWAPRAAEEISSSAVRLMSQLKSFPLDGLAPLLIGSLVTILPVGFVAWYPCRALLGLEPGSWGIFVTPLAALLLALLAWFVFMKGLQHYERTGSQRYSGWGHRS